MNKKPEKQIERKKLERKIKKSSVCIRREGNKKYYWAGVLEEKNR